MNCHLDMICHVHPAGVDVVAVFNSSSRDQFAIFCHTFSAKRGVRIKKVRSDGELKKNRFAVPLTFFFLSRLNVIYSSLALLRTRQSCR